MEDIYKLIDDINLQKLDNLDSRVNDALTSNNDDALFILGETLYNFGLTPQGLEVFRTLYHKYPDESELLIYFIEGLMSENQTDEALEYLSQVAISTEKLMLEADLYQQINMTEVAIDKLIEARELEPNDPIIHFALAEMLYFDGQYLRATREYEVVLDTGEYEVNGINLFARMADCALQSGNYSDAINLYDEINEDEMTSEDFFKKQSRMKNDITHEAIKITKTFYQKIPILFKDISIYNHFMKMKNYPDAIETGKEGLRLNQFYKELMVSTGSLEIEHGDANEGVELLKQALEVDNAYHEPLLILSDLFRNEEDYEAIIALLSYVDEDDLDPVFMWHLAHAFGQEERDKEAQHFFELAYPTMKTQSAFLSDYYYYLIEIGYKEKAKTILQQLIEMDPSNETWQEEANRLDY